MPVVAGAREVSEPSEGSDQKVRLTTGDDPALRFKGDSVVAAVSNFKYRSSLFSYASQKDSMDHVEIAERRDQPAQ